MGQIENIIIRIFKILICALFINCLTLAQASSNFLNHWIGIESLETPTLTYENRNISIIIEEGGEREGYYIYNSSSDFLYNDNLDWAYHYFIFVKDRYDELIFLRRFITPMGVLGYEELTYDLIEWSLDYFVAEHISEDGQSEHQIRMNPNFLTADNQIPIIFNLKQNYPNPFNSKTIIEIEANESNKGTLNIYNINGELIHELFKGKLKVGKNQFFWNGMNEYADQLSAGTYIYKLYVEDHIIQTRKMIYLK
tara:strand:+ start:31 stop:789 length:759 start_codon:yes stop_codon:yes gene_type:complete